MKRRLRDDEGQAIVVVALAVVVLLGALALALDWGYGFTQRRVAQNAADAAAIAAGRALATSTALVNGAIVFTVTQEQLFCVAETYADDNRRALVPGGSTEVLVLQLGDDARSTHWTDVPPGACPAATTGTEVPRNTIYVRAIDATSYRSLVASVVGQPEIRALASAKVRIAGVQDPVHLPVWPMVRHYDPTDFDIGKQCGNPCDPTSLGGDPVTFWSSSGSLKNMVYGQFKGLVDYSRYSTRYPSASQVPQLLAAWDGSGSPEAVPPTPRKTDQSGKCGGAWDTLGDSDPSTNDKQCSIPNWAYYTFRGTVSLTGDWSASVPGGQEIPTGVGSRNKTVCADGARPAGLVAPSCAVGAFGEGDWIETAFGNLGDNVSANLTAYIEQHGVTTPYSELPVPGHAKATYGKSAVIWVYLWDCAETFNGSKPAGDRWSIVSTPKGDCSQINDGAGIPTLDRVHVFSGAPFTFYQGLVSTNLIQGFWGGAFGDPAACQADPDRCQAPNAFNNTAFFVADD